MRKLGFLPENRTTKVPSLYLRSNPTNHGQCNRFISKSTALLWKSMKKYAEWCVELKNGQKDQPRPLWVAMHTVPGQCVIQWEKWRRTVYHMTLFVNKYRKSQKWPFTALEWSMLTEYSWNIAAPKDSSPTNPFLKKENCLLDSKWVKSTEYRFPLKREIFADISSRILCFSTFETSFPANRVRWIR